MRWYDLTDLEYYNYNPIFGCYLDPIFEPYDLNLQCPNLALTDDYDITISVCDKTGAVLEDATAYFDTFLGTYTVAGVDYYYVGIRCDRWSPEMTSNLCFLLKVEIENPDTEEVVFSKYTQLYKLAGSTATPVPAVYIDTGFETLALELCVPADEPANCGNNYVKFGCAFDCIDNYTGEYYGEPSAITGEGTYPFTYERFTYIQGQIREEINEIKRTVSINCRTQKTEWTPKLVLFGTYQNAFPIWKKQDIERMMLASHLYVDDVEYQSIGGKIFERFGTQAYNCQPRYKLSIPLQECYQYQISGCVPDCESYATYYMFPQAFELIYNERKQPIAQDMDELEIYLKTQIGYKSSQQLPFLLPCPVYGLIEVQSEGALPPYFYIDEPIPANRVFAKQLPINTANLASMCNGITGTNQVGAPTIGDIVTIEENVGVPQLGNIVTVEYNEYINTITLEAEWDEEETYTNAVNYLGVGTLNLSLSTDDYSSPLVNTFIGTISENGRPLVTQVIYGDDNPNLLAGSMLTINPDGTIYYSGDANSTTMNTIYLEILNLQYNI